MKHINFAYTSDQLKTIAHNVLERALNLGATSAQVEMNEGINTDVDILNANIENFSQSNSSTLTITVYIGNQSSSVGVSNIQSADIDYIVNKALDIAKYTQSDKANGLPDKELICHDFNDNLQLYNPIELTHDYIIDKAQNIERLALEFDPRLSSDGASISLSKYNFVLADSNGLCIGYPTSRYDASISLIGTTASGMQTDYWYTSARDFNDLTPDAILARQVSGRVLRRLNSGKIKSGKYSVIFEANIAKSLIGCFLGAISGGNLYRKLSFLNDSMGMQVFPDWFNLAEDPFVVKGLASSYCDNEGVKVQKRTLVKDGLVSSYLLSSYSARKLGLTTTGNAGGTHNVFVAPNFSGGIAALANTVKRGLVIIETVGHGVNSVTGNYSMGASGLWIENGEIQFFVDNITIAGNLKDFYKQMQYVSDDSHNGSMQCGSILIDGVSVST